MLPLNRFFLTLSLLLAGLFLGACSSDPYYGGYRGGYYGPGPGYYGGGYYSRSYYSRNYYRYPYRGGYYYHDHDHDHDRPSNGWNRPNNSGPNKPNWANNNAGGGNAQRPAAAPRGGSAPRATGPSRVGVRPPSGGGGGGGDKRKKRN